MIRRPPRSTLSSSSAASDVYKRQGDKGNVLLTVTDWVLSVWDTLDSEFVSKWEKWAQPAIDGVGDVLNQDTGGVLAELGQGLQELSSAITDAIIELFTQLYDWFCLLYTSPSPRDS